MTALQAVCLVCATDHSHLRGYRVETFYGRSGGNSVKGWKVFAILFFVSAAPLAAQTYEHRVLATSRTSTMQKELNENAEAGFRLQSAMGGQRFYAGNEVA